METMPITFAFLPISLRFLLLKFLESKKANMDPCIIINIKKYLPNVLLLINISPLIFQIILAYF
jgi:hypothetical protein